MVQSTIDETSADIQRRLAESEKLSQKEIFDGEILSMTASTAGEVFGDDAKKPEREVIKVHVRVETGEEFEETLSMPSGVRSWRNAAFKLANFKKRYDKIPEVGDAVKVKIDAEGFFRLVL
jgi:hypothetical protein